MKKIQEPIIGGFFATLALLFVSFIENISGSFNYISPIFLSSIADDSILGAFFLQLIAGWIFAFIYSLFFIKILSWAKNDWIRGLIYGIVIAILMEIGLYIAVDNIILPEPHIRHNRHAYRLRNIRYRSRSFSFLCQKEKNK